MPRIVRDRDAGAHAGIRDIARALGVSIGTVDRALHDRPRINVETRTRVLEMAQRLGYRPNLAARHLKLKRKWKISVQLPRGIASFFDLLRDGIQEAAAPFSSSIEMQFRSYPRLGVGDVTLFKRALRENIHGMIIAPGHPSALKNWIGHAAKKRIPVVCVGTDAPKTERMSSVSADPYMSGALAAELMTKCCHEPGSTLVVTGDLNTYDHAEKLRGFRETFKAGPRSARLLVVVEAHDDPNQAYRKTRRYLTEHSNVRRIYVNTSNSLPVIRALKDTCGMEQVSIITTDLFPALARLIRDGKVLATIYQRPRAQGRMAFQLLYELLVEGITPASSYRLRPFTILRSNLRSSANSLPDDLERPMTFLLRQRN